MRSEQEIQDKIKEIGIKLDTNIPFKKREVIDAVLDVLENDIDSDEIEEKYFDEHKTDRESAANNAREWMDGDNDEIDF